jgi:hypothetical protein
VRVPFIRQCKLSYFLVSDLHAGGMHLERSRSVVGQHQSGEIGTRDSSCAWVGGDEVHAVCEFSCETWIELCSGLVTKAVKRKEVEVSSDLLPLQIAGLLMSQHRDGVPYQC